MALWIENVFGGYALLFLCLQSAYDLEIAKKAFLINPPQIIKFEIA